VLEPRPPHQSGRHSPHQSGRHSPHLSGRHSPHLSGRHSPHLSGRHSPHLSGRHSLLAGCRTGPPVQGRRTNQGMPWPGRAGSCGARRRTRRGDADPEVLAQPPRQQPPPAAPVPPRLAPGLRAVRAGRRRPLLEDAACSTCRGGRDWSAGLAWAERRRHVRAGRGECSRGLIYILYV
jgi:hypothetical protein